MNRQLIRRGTIALFSIALLGAVAPPGAGAAPSGPASAGGGQPPGRRPLDDEALAARRLTTHRLVVRFRGGVATTMARRDETRQLSAATGVPVRYVRATS